MRKRSLAMVTVALMGFASGLPLALTGYTLKAWLTDSGLDLRTIGFFSLIAQPYALKFLWAPFLDRYFPPFLGRRRSWMLLIQAALAVFLVLLAFANPRIGVGRVALLGVLVAFASASQDIVIDAWRREAFRERDLGLANAVHFGGYRVAMLVSMSGGLALAQFASFRVTYLVMAGLVAVGILATLLAWSTDDAIQPPRTLAEAVIQPFRQLLARPAFGEVLAFCLLYKIGDQLADTLQAPFLLRGMGFSKLQVASTTKTVGLLSLILGGVVGGALMKKLSLKRALVLFGCIQGGSILAFWALSRLGPRLLVLTFALGLENLAFGMGTAAFGTFVMLLCDKRFTATQYALLTSLLAVTRGYLTAPAGWYAARVGWSLYFLTCAAAAVPGLLLLARYGAWGIDEDNGAAAG